MVEFTVIAQTQIIFGNFVKVSVLPSYYILSCEYSNTLTNNTNW